MGTSVVRVETRERVLWITIDRPEQRNALNDDVTNGIRDALAAAAGDDALRAVVLTGGRRARVLCRGRSRLER